MVENTILVANMKVNGGIQGNPAILASALEEGEIPTKDVNLHLSGAQINPV